MSLKTDGLIVAGVALALIGAAWYAKNKIAQVGSTLVDTAKAVVPYVNPADSSNIVNQGATSLYQSLTGSTGSIGGDLYDLLHSQPDQPAADPILVGP